MLDCYWLADADEVNFLGAEIWYLNDKTFFLYLIVKFDTQPYIQHCVQYHGGGKKQHNIGG